MEIASAGIRGHWRLMYHSLESNYSAYIYLNAVGLLAIIPNVKRSVVTINWQQLKFFKANGLTSSLKLLGIHCM